MRLSLLSRQYDTSKDKHLSTGATDWLVGATMGVVVLLTVAWNGLLLWLAWQLF
jgi:hypothetical protein